MDKEIFLHIGLPKAGSSFLQEKVFSFLNPDELCYNPPEISTYLLPEFMRKAHVKRGYSKDEYETFRNKIYGFLSYHKQKKILISNEGLCGMHFGTSIHHKYLRQLMFDLFPTAKIILVFRDQIEWFQSLYSLSVLYGYLVPFRKFINYRYNSFQSRINTDSWSINALDYSFTDLYNNYFAQVG